MSRHRHDWEHVGTCGIGYKRGAVDWCRVCGMVRITIDRPMGWRTCKYKRPTQNQLDQP